MAFDVGGHGRVWRHDMECNECSMRSCAVPASPATLFAIYRVNSNPHGPRPSLRPAPPPLSISMHEALFVSSLNHGDQEGWRGLSRFFLVRDLILLNPSTNSLGFGAKQIGPDRWGAIPIFNLSGPRLSCCRANQARAPSDLSPSFG